MIQVERVSKYYGSHCAVADLSFAIGGGQCVGLLGLNGAGKTTTLKLLAGLTRPSGGRIRVNGVDVVADPTALRGRVGYLADAPPLYPEMTTLDYLAFAAGLRGMAGRRRSQAVSRALETCGLESVSGALLGTLSHGYRQRVGIAQAVVHQPPLLVLDEPMQGLDPVQTVQLRAALRRLRGDHTILLSTHMLHEISQACDRVLVLHQGEIALQGTEAELSAQAHAGARLELDVRGDEAALRRALDAVPEVADVHIVAGRAPTAAAAGATGSGHLMTVTLTAPEAARPAVSRAIVEAGLGLSRMQPGRSDLEAILVQLTARPALSADAEATA